MHVSFWHAGNFCLWPRYGQFLACTQVFPDDTFLNIKKSTTSLSSASNIVKGGCSLSDEYLHRPLEWTKISKLFSTFFDLIFVDLAALNC